MYSVIGALDLGKTELTKRQNPDWTRKPNLQRWTSPCHSPKHQNPSPVKIFYNNYYSNNLTIKLTFITLVLIFQYHIFTGIRHMLMDFHILEESLSTSFRSAIFTLLVFLLNAILTILVML